MSQPLDLTNDELLLTTRAVRRRLDFERPVERDLLLECLGLALQAPTGGGKQAWRWVVVHDPHLRQQAGAIYRAAAHEHFPRLIADAVNERRRQLYRSALEFSDHIHRAPALVIPCADGRVEGEDAAATAAFYGSILPAAWSFQLALRTRGLGTCWTTVHLQREREMGHLLGIPETVTQVALLPVAYTLGTDFKPASRKPVEEVVSFDGW